MTTIDRGVSTNEFVASPTLTADLQTVLVDLLELGNQAKQAHWNLVGAHFRSIHLELDEMVEMVREHADTIAERMRALDAVPDGRTRTVADTTALAAFPAGEISVDRAVAVTAERILTAVNVIRAVHDEVDAQDPTSADLLHAVLEGLEKQRWMLTAQLRHISN
jgi:starvation-inducible DNA-binding protein